MNEANRNTRSGGGPTEPSGGRATDSAHWLRHVIVAGAGDNGVQRVDLVCREHPAPRLHGCDRSIVVRLLGCLATLPRHVPVELLAELRRLPADAVQVRLRGDGCARPDEVAARFDDLSGLLPGRLTIVCEPAGGKSACVVDAGHPPLGRRVVLGALPTDPDPVPTAPADGGTVTFQGPERPDVRSEHRRLIDALAQLLPRGPAPPDDRPGPGLVLRAGGGTSGRGCTSCEVCLRSCPEGALAMRGDDTRTLLEFVALCTGCRECLPACPEGVLVPWRPARWSEQLRGAHAALPLATVATTTCLRCGARFPDDGGELCDVCAFRRGKPFGSHLPPQVQAVLDRGNAPHTG